jgi:hypothetical protein
MILSGKSLRLNLNRTVEDGIFLIAKNARSKVCMQSNILFTPRIVFLIESIIKTICLHCNVEIFRCIPQSPDGNDCNYKHFIGT